MPGKVLVSVASQGRENYNKAQLSLIQSAVGKWDGDWMVWSVDGYVDEYRGVPIRKGWPMTAKHGIAWQHKDMPYQFKPFAVLAAYEAGYSQVLWCDSTIHLMQTPDWSLAQAHGIAAWDNEGHPLDKWMSDYAAAMIGIDPRGVQQIMACCIMFDFTHPKTLQVLEDWLEGSLNNSFHHSTNGSRREGFVTDRHDQSYLSGLMHKHGIPVQPYGMLAYPHYTPIKPTFLNVGVL